MRTQDLFEKYGEGDRVTADQISTLYHLCDYHGYSYTIAQDALRTLRENYVSTTTDPQMNDVGGRSHYDFKFVIDGPALLTDYEGFHYTDHYYELSTNGRRTKKAFAEREVGIRTKSIEPFSKYLIGTILRFSLFSEKGLQWMLYRPLRNKGFMDYQKDEAPQAIFSLYHQLFVLRKPVWVGEQGRLLSAEEVRFVRDAYRIAKSGGGFSEGFRKLADKYPLVDHDQQPVTGTDVKRMFLAPKLVKMLNDYYRDRPRNKINIDQVKNVMQRIFTTIGIGNNAVSVLMGALESSGLLHRATAPVTWGGIIRHAMTGNIDETLEAIQWFGEREKSTREWHDEEDNDIFDRSSHYTTSFGRTMER